MPSYEWTGPPASQGRPPMHGATSPASGSPQPASRSFDRRRNPQWRSRLERRARAEFAEMPGMHLTLLQAQRLFGLRRDICERILDGLVREGFLATAGPGTYTRRESR